MKFFLSVTIVFLLTAFADASQAQTVAPTAWTPELQMKVKTLGPPRVSPDGKRVAYTVVNEMITADNSEFVTQIFLSNTDGSGSFHITFGEKSSTNPKWSPDGNSLAFTSNRKDNKNNLYLLRLNGGEAEPLTDLKSSIADYEWSPDGRWIAFAMTDAKTEEEEKNDKGKADHRWVDENVKMSRLYVVALQAEANGKREPRKLTMENYTVSGSFDWSSDGKQIVFAHTKTPGANDWTSSDVSLVEVSSGKVSSLAATPAAETSPTFAPDGKSVALLISNTPPRWAQSGAIHVLSSAGGTPKSLAASYDGQPNIAGWSADGKRIYFSESKGTGTRIYVVDVAANKVAEINQTDEVY